MRILLIAGIAALLAGCGQSDDGATNQAAAQPRKKKPAHCFFKDKEMKAFAASRGKDGNVIVRGKAYRSDSRYKALFGPPVNTGTSASIAPTITVNDSYAAPDDWWDLKATIPNSAAVDTIAVTCGARTVAELRVSMRG